MSTNREKKISLEGFSISGFAGVRDSNLKLIQNHFNGKIVLRGEDIFIATTTPEELEKIEKLINILKHKLRRS